VTASTRNSAVEEHYATLLAELRKDPARTKARLPQLQKYKTRPEWAAMAVAILKNQAFVVGDGKAWWRTGASQFDWTGVAARYDTNRDGAITRNELPQEELFFDRLDFDRDGRFNETDLNWSQRWPDLSESLFQQLDHDSNGRVTPEEFSEFFRRADSLGLGFVDQDDLRVARLSPGSGQGKKRPTQVEMLTRLYTGELGSLGEGPRLGDAAPDFRLSLFNGGGEASLSASRGHKPVVLVFGSFT
jgi:hypothetical protein